MPPNSPCLSAASQADRYPVTRSKPFISKLEEQIYLAATAKAAKQCEQDQKHAQIHALRRPELGPPKSRGPAVNIFADIVCGEKRDEPSGKPNVFPTEFTAEFAVTAITSNGSTRLGTCFFSVSADVTKALSVQRNKLKRKVDKGKLQISEA